MRERQTGSRSQEGRASVWERRRVQARRKAAGLRGTPLLQVRGHGTVGGLGEPRNCVVSPYLAATASEVTATLDVSSEVPAGDILSASKRRSLPRSSRFMSTISKDMPCPR